MTQLAITAQAPQLTLEDKTVILLPTDIAEVQQHWLQGKRVEYAQAKEALTTLRKLVKESGRVKRLRERVRFLGKVIQALEQGYVPVPRFQTATLDLDAEEVPFKVLLGIEKAQATRAFSEFRIARGAEPERGTRYQARRTRRDPIIVGVIKTPLARFRNPRRPWETLEEQQEEHFLIAWWRPEDVGPQEMA